MTRIAEMPRALSAVVVTGLLLPFAGLAEEESAPGGTYLSDTQRERTPSITAFPKYPYVARRDRMEGEATICFTVNAKGQIIRPGVRSSSHRIFDKPALEAIRASTFEPLKPGESKSNLKTCRIFRFRLDPISVANEKG
ncbi:MAG: TonB family protein [Woeseiaceae bacterium]|nr:TonB family protein [Woeseiaceae bacterium]